jgi:hypothetical protein
MPEVVCSQNTARTRPSATARDEHERRLAPRDILGRELEPVPLDLLAGRVVDLDRHLVAAAVLADQTDRPQLQAPQLADQRRVGPIEPRLDELAMKHGRLQVWVLDKPRRDVVAERLQAARRRPALLPGAVAGQVLADRLRIAAGVTADRSDRPPARLERVKLHVVLLWSIPSGASLLAS